MERNMLYTRHRLPIDEIEALGQIRVQRACLPMRMEVHPDAYEILYLQTGEKQLTVEQEDFFLRGGDALIIRPGERHGKADSVQNRSSLLYVIFKDPGRDTGFLGMSVPQRQALARGLRARRTLRMSDEMKRLMDRMLAEAGGDETLTGPRMRALLTLFLDGAARGGDPDGPEMPPDIRRAIRCIEDTPAEMFPVWRLAQTVGLSEARFKQKFKQYTGVPPAEYVVRRHVTLARELLAETSLSVTEVAMRLGFSSSQHFSQLFKRYTGLSPTAYRKK